MRTLYLGLMSGTSLDGVDAVLVEASPAGHLLAHGHQALPTSLRDELLALNTGGGPDELARAACAARDLADVYAHSVAMLLSTAGVPAEKVRWRGKS